MTSGNWFGRRKLLKIQSGSVWVPAPDVNLVTIDLVEREREGEQGPGDQRRPDRWEGHPPEGRERVGPGIGQVPRRAP